jgi:uncharacterized heparinase superfamily protein
MFNVVHQRVLRLANDGRRLDGEDLFTPAQGETIAAGQDQFAVRFHLHPSVKANRLSDGHAAMLLMPNKDVWTFDAHEDRIEIEESVYLAASDGPRRSAQIVIYGSAREVRRVRWSFACAIHASAAPGRRNARMADPQLPL